MRKGIIAEFALCRYAQSRDDPLQLERTSSLPTADKHLASSTLEKPKAAKGSLISAFQQHAAAIKSAKQPPTPTIADISTRKRRSAESLPGELFLSFMLEFISWYLCRTPLYAWYILGSCLADKAY